MTCPLQWRHNGRDCVPKSPALLNRLFRLRSKKTSKLRVTGLCAGNSPGLVNSPHKRPVTRKMFPFDDVIMSSNGRYAITQTNGDRFHWRIYASPGVDVLIPHTCHLASFSRWLVWPTPAFHNAIKVLCHVILALYGSFIWHRAYWHFGKWPDCFVGNSWPGGFCPESRPLPLTCGITTLLVTLLMIGTEQICFHGYTFPCVWESSIIIQLAHGQDLTFVCISFYYYHQIESIKLSHYYHIFPLLCAWGGWTIICCRFHISWEIWALFLYYCAVLKCAQIVKYITAR